MYLDEVVVSLSDDVAWVVAMMSGVRKLDADEIVEIENDIGEEARVQVELTIVQESADVYDRHGGLRFEWLTPYDTAGVTMTEVATEAMRGRLADEAFALEGLTLSLHADSISVLLEVAGPRIVSTNDVTAWRDELETLLQQSVSLFVRSRPEVVVTPDGTVPFETLRRSTRARQAVEQPGLVRDLAEAMQ